uniref:Putative peptidase n=1 Tax=viral metagenome TaxID=1070528 RepID=A0A6H1ZKB6_9ZZZZ
MDDEIKSPLVPLCERGQEREIRAFEVVEMEVREDDKQPRITGHAAVFNKRANIMGLFEEEIEPGAFAEAVKKDDVRALMNHDVNFVLGRSKSGTLRMEEDEKGLAIEIDPPDTQWARDLMVSIKRRDITQMSFAFNIRDKKGEEWINEEGKLPLRKVRNVTLFDVSPVTFPAYPQTDVKVRSVYAAVGIDYDLLAGVIARSRAGADVSGDDMALVRRAIEVLGGILERGSQAGTPVPPKEGEPVSEGAFPRPGQTQGSAPTGCDGYAGWLGRMRRELEIAELS